MGDEGNFQLERGREKAHNHLPPFVIIHPMPTTPNSAPSKDLDLHEHLVKNPIATFFVRAAGDSMSPHIHPDDLLVVDRSQEAVNGSVVIAAVEGEFTVKRLLRKKGRVLLVPENDDYPVLDITEQEDTALWGVATYAIHKVKPDAGEQG
jgi:DNA polymerase V